MENRIVRVAIRHDMMDKAGEQQRRLTGKGWENTQLTIKELISHIKAGFPFTHHFAGGRRNTDNFQGAELLIADIDKGMSLNEALEHPFIQEHAGFIYTTPSHTENSHRFRIVFPLERRIFDSAGYRALYESLNTEIPTDPAVKSCATFFFGNSKAKILWIGKSIPDHTITKMISNGMEKRLRVSNPLAPVQIEPDTPVRVKNKRVMPLSALEANTSIHCPFETHPDAKASAFVKINNDGVRGVECRSCHHSAWSEPSKRQAENFAYFDNMVRTYAQQPGHLLTYDTLDNFDHDIDTHQSQSNYHLSNSKQLSIKNIRPGLTLIKSPKGSGKTHLLGKIISLFKDPKFRTRMKVRDGRVMLVGHRRTLIRESSGKLGLECYLDTGSYDTILDSSGGFARQFTLKPHYYGICLDSLSTRIRPRYEKYTVVIIDESEQVFSHFLSEHMKSPTNNYEILSNLIKHAQYVFCLDADLDTITLSGLISCLSYAKDSRERQSHNETSRHFKQLHCHLNTYMAPGKNLELYNSLDHLLDDLKNDIAAGKKCYVTSNSKRLAQTHYEYFRKHNPEKRFKLIVSDLGDDLEIKAFLDNIRIDILNYDAVFSSPSIGTGIDITFPREAAKIDCVYGFFRDRINTHFDIDQQLGRVRHPGSVRVWISPKCERMSTDRNRILREFLYGDEVNGLRYYLDECGAHAESGDHPIMDLFAEVKAVRRRSMNRLKHNFVTHKQKNGWNVIKVERDKAAAERGEIIADIGAGLRHQEFSRRIMSARDIRFKEFMTLKRKRDNAEPTTDAEKASWFRYWLQKFYYQDVSEELIDFDDEGRMRQRIVLLATVLNPSLTYRRYLDIPSDPGALTSYDAKKINMKTVKKAVFVREILTVAGVYNSDTLTFNLNATFGTETLLVFVNFLEQNSERFVQLFDMELYRHIRTRPVFQLGKILELIGLDHIQVQFNKGRNKGKSTYRLNRELYDKLLQIISYRAEKLRENEAKKGEENPELAEELSNAEFKEKRRISQQKLRQRVEPAEFAKLDMFTVD